MSSTFSAPNDGAFVSLPGIQLNVVEDYTATSRCDEGYLRVRRRRLVAYYEPEAASSKPFAYDVVERWNADAVAIVPYFRKDNELVILLRSSIRPPVALRPEPIIKTSISLPIETLNGEFWEIPAGLVEPHERSAQGLLECAARELQEELGLVVDVKNIHTLGGPIFPSAGVIGECIFLYACEVEPLLEYTPQGDGSPLEHGARILEIPLTIAIDWCNNGWLPDVKTEIGLRRFLSQCIQ